MYGGTASKEFIMIQKFIEGKCGISLGEEKAYLLESKLARLLAESGKSSFEELYLKICSTNDTDLIDSVIDAVTINETFWFRDKTPWYIIEELLLPALIAEFRKGERDRIRIWSAACSYGQEPYSVAMCIDSCLMSVLKPSKSLLLIYLPMYFRWLRRGISIIYQFQGAWRRITNPDTSEIKEEYGGWMRK